MRDAEMLAGLTPSDMYILDNSCSTQMMIGSLRMRRYKNQNGV
jgi:hypothetical protein